MKMMIKCDFIQGLRYEIYFGHFQLLECFINIYRFIKKQLHTIR